MDWRTAGVWSISVLWAYRFSARRVDMRSVVSSAVVVFFWWWLCGGVAIVTAVELWIVECYTEREVSRYRGISRTLRRRVVHRGAVVT